MLRKVKVKYMFTVLFVQFYLTDKYLKIYWKTKQSVYLFL